jgi:hypothetical protein
MLARKLNDVKTNQIFRKVEHIAGDGNDDADSDDDSEIIPVESTPVQSLAPTNRVKARMIQTIAKGRCRTPSKSKPKKVVISLLTDDEEEDLTAAGPSSRRSLPSSMKYVPVDNSNFTAYAQTHQFTNNEKNRKRVTMR